MLIWFFSSFYIFKCLRYFRNYLKKESEMEEGVKFWLKPFEWLLWRSITRGVNVKTKRETCMRPIQKAKGRGHRKKLVQLMVGELWRGGGGDCWRHRTAPFPPPSTASLILNCIQINLSREKRRAKKKRKIKWPFDLLMRACCSPPVLGLGCDHAVWVFLEWTEYVVHSVCALNCNN